MRDHDIERLFAEHAQRLYAFVSYRTGDSWVAEEIVADTFERVVRTRRRFDRRKGSEQSWIYTIALNLLTDHYRRNGAEERALASVMDDADRGEGNDAIARAIDRDELFRALSRLDAEMREVLALRYGADLRLKDIAAITGHPLSTVHDRLRRGLSALEAEIERGEQPPPSSSRAGSRYAT